MTLKEMNNALTVEMKKYIKANHIDTGALYNSIRFKCILIGTKLDVKFNTLEYIQYLDQGTFLQDFYQLPQVREIFAEFIRSYMEGLLFDD